MSQYVYGITVADVDLPTGLQGVRGQDVRAEPVGEVTVLVSDLPGDDETGLPEDIRAHAAVLDAVAARSAVLPMTFATIVPDVAALSEELPAQAQQEYLAGLRRVAGAVQFTLRARFIREVVLAELVAQDPEIANLRELTAGRSEDESYYQRIELGEKVVQGLERLRPAEAAAILDALRAVAVEVRPRETGQADDVLEAAILVRHEEAGSFEDLVEQLAAERADRIRFRLVGPQAPYDFVTEE